ncbi:hypothetical protein HC251_24055 [Iamia sp. SCSIO 61187]|uniref:NADH-ubiquinone oxidoreductase-F iron-sulfur binding region domain-containing protein n=1 Tax=Iamia sp. SCSIO 61187 TaxID=2722752 RepID=UPI001C63A7C6|nr:NADH-ubiquinone oxidoreductase-F iron-sulfur binding region domain-containing protein [Iamia sp. SCSIO 61187]QYG95198.1 hypothetical protein HC251_24055 [Iamia sp. SCSIO 61187]
MADTQLSRVLPLEPIATLADYESAGGGCGLEAARRLGPVGTIEEIEASGLRGRGGGGFPTGTKWRTIAEHTSTAEHTTVVINGAEGEPGSFKDRTLLRRSPYGVIEGALIAAEATAADRVVIAVKETFTVERERLEAAVAEVVAAGWADGVSLEVVAGPSAYLYGEETALLEVLDGRPPFPRIAPPFRHGVEETPSLSPGEAAGTDMTQEGGSGAAPTLVNNVETAAHAAAILAQGAQWFREMGTAGSPGTFLCTISGDTVRHGVRELAMGTTLGDAIDVVGGGHRKGRRLIAALSGVANALVPQQLFDTPLTYEAMSAIGSGMGAAGFLVVDDASDLTSVVAGVSRFLAVESCGQCTPCKVDGLAISESLARIAGSNAAEESDLEVVTRRSSTVSNGARCYLGIQHETVVRSLLEVFPDAIPAHLDGRLPVAPPTLVAPIIDIVDGRAVLDRTQADKQPDWTHDATDSGKTPVERFGYGTAPA